MVMIQLMRMSSYAKNKLQMCSVTLHHFRRRQMWGKFSQIHHFLSVTKNYLSRLNNLFMVMIQLMSMSSYADNKLQMCSITNISVDVAKCGENFTNLPSTLTILCYKK